MGWLLKQIDRFRRSSTEDLVIGSFMYIWLPIAVLELIGVLIKVL